MALPRPVSLNLDVPWRAEAVPFFFYPASRQHIVEILEGRTYPIVKNIGTVATILDIGANVGAASVMLASHYPDARVHAFEPGPDSLALLSQNTEFFPSICIHGFGLGAEGGRHHLYRSRWDPMSASTLSSTENTEDFDIIEIRRAKPAIESLGITAIDVLKIDTEGCEVPILADLAALIAATKVIYLEYHSEHDRRCIDERLAGTHVLGFAAVRHPHRGEVCYVHRDTPFAKQHEALIVHQRI
jgi:FkbM family methyltransferase